MRVHHARPLSHIDAFFVAYQEQTGILMQFGVEVDVNGSVSRDALERTLSYMAGQWPQLGQHLHRHLGGLVWRGDCHFDQMLKIVSSGGREAIAKWRNQPINPFREPSFQVLAVMNPAGATLAFRAHHAVADGAAMFIICLRALHILGDILAGEDRSSFDCDKRSPGHDVSPRNGIPFRQLVRGWTRMRRVAKDQSRRSAVLSVRAWSPGNTRTCERTVDTEVLSELGERAADASVTMPWLFAGAWVRAIGRWNVLSNCKSTNHVSLEVPVNLRGGNARNYVGNLISPLVLFADPIQSLEDVSRELLRQFREGLRKRAHMVLPVLASPARYLPWPVFRRFAVNSTSTGFASSHFTWLQERRDIYNDVASRSGGALRLLAHHVFGPVCLHMGAAVIVIVLPGSTKICLTYRETALQEDEAETLTNLLLAELTGQYTPLVSLPQ